MRNPATPFGLREEVHGEVNRKADGDDREERNGQLHKGSRGIGLGERARRKRVALVLQTLAAGEEICEGGGSRGRRRRTGRDPLPVGTHLSCHAVGEGVLENGRDGFRGRSDREHAKSLEVHRTHKGGLGEHHVPGRDHIGSGLPGVALNVGLPKEPVPKPFPVRNDSRSPLGSQLQGRISRPDIVARVCDDVLSVVARCALEHLGELPVIARRNVNRLVVAGCRVRLKDASHVPSNLVEEVAR